MEEIQAAYRYEGIKIGGNEYNVLCDDENNIVATECVGSWPMSTVNIGSQWLATQLQQAVYDRRN